MFAVPTEITLIKYAVPIAASDIAKGALFGKRLDTTLPQKLFIWSEMLQWVYDQNPDYTDIQKLANYIYSYGGKYCLQAQGTIGGGRYINIDGNVVLSRLGDGFPIRKTSADFESDGLTLIDTRLVGKNLVVFVNELNVYLQAVSGFTYQSNGIKIKTGAGATIPDFDASVNSYTLIIQRVY